ncbi:MAG TPA: hypothetical protein VGF40_01310, partial [Thermoanaerobaculia bacterium]
MNFRIAFLLAAGLLAAPTLSLAAQTAPPALAPPAAAAPSLGSPQALVTALYEAVSAPPGTSHDWDRFRSLFAPKAQLVVRTAKGALRTMSVEEFVASASANPEAFVERELASRMERWGHIAHSWSSYEGVIGDGATARTIRGVNSFQMAEIDGAWKVVTIFW